MLCDVVAARMASAVAGADDTAPEIPEEGGRLNLECSRTTKEARGVA
jgi:hypothetical protein